MADGSHALIALGLGIVADEGILLMTFGSRADEDGENPYRPCVLDYQ
jgi:hypothetical protein